MNTSSLPRRTFIQQLTAALAGSWAASRQVSGVQAPFPDTIAASMERAAKCCLAWLNPAEQFLPTGGYEVAHDTGRWWDAMLRHEAATGTRIPFRAEQVMMTNLRALTDNDAALLTSKLCNPHNLRESMLTYTALMHHRKSEREWARQKGRTLVENILRLLEPDGQMNYVKLAALTAKPLTNDQLMVQRSPKGEWFNATGSTGRALEGIVLFHQATGDASAKELAQRLAEVHLRQVIDPSGQIRAELLDPAHIGHTHSYCGTLRGLLLHGLATDDKKYVDAVASTYRNGLWGKAISHSGWTPHDQGKPRFHGPEGDPVGEHASCGDVAQIALWLALRAGQTDLLDDVERMIRARLLPSQKVDPSHPRSDGAWGVYSHPFGYGAILDVFAAVLHSMADFHQHIVTTTGDTLSVNLHFSINTPSVTVISECNHNALLHITPKHGQAIRVRVPSWASRDSVQLKIADQSLPLRWDGSYLAIDQENVSPGVTITLQHDLPEKQTVEEMPVSHRQFHLTWRGDKVIDCDPKVPIYPGKKA